MTTPLTETVKAGREVERLTARLLEAKARRLEAVRAAHAEGKGATQIGREVGLTRQQVYNLLADNRLDTEGAA